MNRCRNGSVIVACEGSKNQRHPRQLRLDKISRTWTNVAIHAEDPGVRRRLIDRELGVHNPVAKSTAESSRIGELHQLVPPITSRMIPTAPDDIRKNSFWRCGAPAMIANTKTMPPATKRMGTPAKTTTPKMGCSIGNFEYSLNTTRAIIARRTIAAALVIQSSNRRLRVLTLIPTPYFAQAD